MAFGRAIMSLVLVIMLSNYVFAVTERLGGRTGGLEDIPNFQNDHEVQSLARFAVEEYNSKQKASLSLSKVVKAQRQVVAGTMYYLTEEVLEGGKKSVYLAKVWVKPWMQFKKLVDFAPVH